MPRTACTFRQSDVTKFIKGVRAAGVEIKRVEVATDGKIVVVTGETSVLFEAARLCADVNEWDS